MASANKEMQRYLREANEDAKLKPLKPSKGETKTAAAGGGYMIRGK